MTLVLVKTRTPGTLGWRYGHLCTIGAQVAISVLTVIQISPLSLAQHNTWNRWHVVLTHLSSSLPISSQWFPPLCFARDSSFIWKSWIKSLWCCKNIVILILTRMPPLPTCGKFVLMSQALSLHPGVKFFFWVINFHLFWKSKSNYHWGNDFKSK